MKIDFLSFSPSTDCLKAFSRSEYLEEHKPYCANIRGQQQIMPEFGECIDFKNYQKQYLSELTGYYDLVCIFLFNPPTMLGL